MRRLLVTLILGGSLASAAGCADLGISNPFESTPTAASSQLLGISLPAGMELSTQHCARTTGSDGQPQGMETAYGQADRMQVAQSLFNNMQGSGWNLRMSLRKADRIMLAFENGNRLAVISLYSQTVYSCVAEIWVSEKLADGSSLNLLPLRGEGSQNSGGFGGFGGGSGFSNRGNDLNAEVQITFDEAVFGCEKTITIQNPNQPGSRPQTLQVKIPAGIETGKSIRLAGKGMPGTGGGAAGDLFLKITVSEKTGWTRKGMDVYTDVEVPFTTAVFGGEALVHTLYGDVVCKIKAGTRSGTKIRLRGKGIVSLKDSNVHGDQYAVVRIEVPSDLSAEAKQKLKEFEEICKRDGRFHAA